tara:strand:- start:1968 stop:2927 length:960 start_codon:yes stop_codon:yes gene_type:complete
MRKQPTIYSSEILFELPSDNPHSAKRILLEHLQNSYQDIFNAKVIAKLDNAVNTVNRLIDAIGHSTNLTESRNVLVESIQALSNDGAYWGFGTKNVPKFDEVSSSLSNVQNVLRQTPSIKISRDTLNKVNNSLNKLQGFISQLPSKLTSLPSYPVSKDLPEIGTIERNCTREYSDGYEERATGEKKSVSVLLDNVPLEVTISTSYGEMGSISIEEQWSAGGRKVRAGNLPSEVKVYYDPSAEDNDPSFSVSDPVAFLNKEYSDLHERFISRSLACQYIKPEDDDHKFFTANRQRYIDTKIGKSAIQRDKSKQEEMSYTA